MEPKKRKSKPRRGRRPANSPDWSAEFLEAIIEGAHVRDACAEVGINPSMPYKRRKDDSVFAKAWLEASEVGTNAIEAEATRRAFHGTLRPVFHKGKIVGHVREYSDTLIQFLLRARRPKKYRENVKHEHGGGIDLRHDGMAEGMTDEQLARIAASEDGQTTKAATT